MHLTLEWKTRIGKNATSRSIPVLVIAATGLLLMLPIILFGIPNNADDAWAHSRWQKLFALQFWRGDLYPRWLSDINDGFGSPAFFFYPPLTHFIGAISYPLFPDPLGFSHRVAFAMVCAFVAGGIGTYAWLKKVVGHEWSATIGALFYLLAPYHLFVDTYLRTAAAELWAFAWAPWTLFSIHLFTTRSTRAIAICSLTVAALLFSHAPSSLFLIPAYCCYATFVAKQERRPRVFFYTLVCIALACLLSAIYLATALTHTGHINTSALFTGYYDTLKWFFFNEMRWPNQTTENAIIRVAAPQNIAAVMLAIGCLTAVREKKVRAYTWLSLAGMTCVFILMTRFSLPMWKAFPIMQKMQFPWRMLMLQSVFLASLAASCSYGITMLAPNRKRKILASMVLLLLAGCLAVNVVLTIHAKPHFFWDEVALDNRDTPEYSLGDVVQLEKLFPGGADVAVFKGHGEAKLIKKSPRSLLLEINALDDVRIIIRQFSYPGWEYKADSSASESRPVSVLSHSQPILALDAGPGHHRMEIFLTRTKTEDLGIILSIAGLLALSLFLWLDARRKKEPPDEPLSFNEKTLETILQPAKEKMHL